MWDKSDHSLSFGGHKTCRSAKFANTQSPIFYVTAVHLLIYRMDILHKKQYTKVYITAVHLLITDILHKKIHNGLYHYNIFTDI